MPTTQQDEISKFNRAHPIIGEMLGTPEGRGALTTMLSFSDEVLKHAASKPLSEAILSQGGRQKIGAAIESKAIEEAAQRKDERLNHVNDWLKLMGLGEGFSLVRAAGPRSSENFDICFNNVAVASVSSKGLHKLAPEDLFTAVDDIKPSIRGPLHRTMKGIDLPIVYPASLRDTLAEYEIKVGRITGEMDVLFLNRDPHCPRIDLQDGTNKFIELSPGSNPSQVILMVHEKSGRVVSYNINAGRFDFDSRTVKEPNVS